MEDVRRSPATFGCLPELRGNGEKVVVEYSSPNIAKPFHAGHLRSTIIGAFIARLHKKLGFDVTQINYLGDWGKQFGLVGLGFGRFGSRETLARDPIRHLFDVYVRTNKEMEKDPKVDADARAYFQRLEAGEPAEMALWQEFRALSVRKYHEIYARLHIEFDEYASESHCAASASAWVKPLFEKGLLKKEANGAYSLATTDLPSTVVQKSDGTTVYLLRDFAELLRRKEKYAFKRMIYVAGAPQDLHFQQLFWLLRAAGVEANLTHVNFGSVKGFSTRRGNVVFLEDILDEAKTRMRAIIEQSPEKAANIPDLDAAAEALGLAAVVIQDLKAKRIRDYDFDWDRMLKSEGDTGPFLQYTHARLASIERKTAIQLDNYEVQADKLVEPEAAELGLHLALYPDAVGQALTQLDPSVMVQYLFQLARIVSRANNVLLVRGQEPSLQVQRARLLFTARTVLSDGMRLLGLTPLNHV
eukprot:m.59991 g.59991  ORF g.59991 m.59991 type:complete len:472 (-) comp13628_c0_seq1:357-1772(-)